MGPREVYEMTGDSATAMRLLVQGNNNHHHEEEPPQQHPQEEYNCLLLSALATTTINNNNTISLLDDSLEDARNVVLQSYTTPSIVSSSLSSSLQPPTQRRRRKIMEEWILAYNRGLVLFAKGHIAASIRTAWTYLQPIILGIDSGVDNGVAEPSSSSSSPPPPLEWVCRMGFLLLEGMFTLYPTRRHGRTTSTTTTTTTVAVAAAAAINNNNNNNNDDDGSSSSFDLSLIDRVLSWLIENVEKTTAAPPSSLVTTVSSSSTESRHHNNINNTTDPTTEEEENGSTTISPDPQLKFLLSLYKARFDFFERTTEDALLRDKHMRSARKELKVAMEIFQHKLRPASSSSAAPSSSASASASESLNSGEGKEEGEGRESGTFHNSNSQCSSTAADAVSLASVSSYSEEVAAATAGHTTTTTTTNNNNSNSNNDSSSSSSSSKQQQQQTSSPTPTHTQQTHTLSTRPTTSSAAAVSSTPVPSTTTTAATAAACNNSNRQLSRILQGQNQAALNLKANAEQLKGNVKKSLILCGEAHSFNNNNTNATTSPPTSDSSSSTRQCSNYYEAIHQNNLGIVYETSGNSHLALHAFSKAVRCASSHAPHTNTNTNGTNNSTSTALPRFDADGTARPEVTFAVLNNAAVCALKARNFSAAYDCYAIGLATSPVWRTRPRTWLRLSEACIGLNTNVKKERTERAHQCSKVEIEGKAMGVLLTDTIQYQGDQHRTVTTLPALASAEDRQDIRQHALLRARMALETAVQLFSEEGANADPVAFQSARLSLAYIMLEEKNFKKALDYALLVLCHHDGEDQDTSNNNNNETTTTTTTTPTVRSDNNHHESGEKTPAAAAAVVVEEDTVAFVHQTLLKRQQATARMYASEAHASLGDAMASMKLLVGDGKDDAFDRLSSDLGGVTMERAASRSTAKARLAKAQTMVRCSASAASAALGNVTASKQLAMSAQAMENSYSPSRAGTSQARKALIYCMLREGNHGAALTLLRSAR
mmetsp:Transcript_22453/g.25273  ORF Transcript_22453/g.25273 Transcript_22453/m.25273 type:complete len:995 (+) Transcript_22453:122-3106(+)